MRWTPRVTVAAVVESAGRFLFVEERIAARLVLNQPAGHLEAGETLREAIRREVLEETGLHFEPQGLVGIYRWPAADGTVFLRFCFAGSSQPPAAAAPRDPQIVRVRWLSRQELAATSRRVRSPLVERCIDDFIASGTVPLGVLRDVA